MEFLLRYLNLKGKVHCFFVLSLLIDTEILFDLRNSTEQYRLLLYTLLYLDVFCYIN